MIIYEEDLKIDFGNIKQIPKTRKVSENWKQKWITELKMNQKNGGMKYMKSIEANDLKTDLMTKYLIEIGSSDEQILEGIILNILSNYDYPLEDEGIIMEEINNVEICEDVADEIIDTTHSNFSTQLEEHYEKALEEKFGDDIETLKSIAFIYYDAYNKRNLDVVANFESTAYEPNNFFLFLFLFFIF